MVKDLSKHKVQGQIVKIMLDNIDVQKTKVEEKYELKV